MLSFQELNEKLKEFRVHHAILAASEESHNQWLSDFRKDHPEEAKKPRIRERCGKNININLPWHKLDKAAQTDNLKSMIPTMKTVMKHKKGLDKNDRKTLSAAGAEEHENWMKLNPPNETNKHLHVPYSQLSREEQKKDDDRILALHRHLQTKSALSKAKKGGMFEE